MTRVSISGRPAEAHAYWRDPAGSLIGLFGAGYYAEVGEETDDRQWGFAAGAEAQAHVGMSTIYAQMGYLTFPEATADDADFPLDTFFLRGAARHFFTENTKLEAQLGTAIGTFDGGETDFYLVDWAIEAEQAVGQAGVGLSLFARYEGIYAEEVDEDDNSLDTSVKFGLRARFGGGGGESLLANDRNGVSLDLPDAGRWAGVLGGPVE